MARAQDDTRRLWHVLFHTVLSTRRLPSGSCGQTVACLLAPAAGLLAPAHSPNIFPPTLFACRFPTSTSGLLASPPPTEAVDSAAL